MDTDREIDRDKQSFLALLLSEDKTQKTQSNLMFFSTSL